MITEAQQKELFGKYGSAARNQTNVVRIIGFTPTRVRLEAIPTLRVYYTDEELKKQHSPKIYGYTILDVNWIRENPLHTPLIGRLPKNNDYFNASLIPPTDDNTAGLFCQDEYFEIISLTLEELAKRKHGWGTVLD